jgi:excisionase family DNA binding protein
MIDLADLADLDWAWSIATPVAKQVYYYYVDLDAITPLLPAESPQPLPSPLAAEAAPTPTPREKVTRPAGQPLAATVGNPPSGLPLLATPQAAAAVMGVTESQIRLLLHEGRIARVRIGKRDLIPRDAIERFISSNTVDPSMSWREETTAPSSAGSPSAAAGTSPGQKAVAAASAQRALRTANKLRSLSPSGSTSEPARPAARVIPLKS